jgi:DNA-binding transcriptional regulator YdaS (Cro superfamily)
MQTLPPDSGHLTPHEALLEAVRIAGGQNKIAAVCDVSQPSVFRWIHKHKQAPAARVLAIEARTGVSRHLLRPDIYPRDGAAGAVVAAVPGAVACNPGGVFYRPHTANDNCCCPCHRRDD